MKKSTSVSVNVNEHILKDKGCACENYALLIVSMDVAMCTRSQAAGQGLAQGAPVVSWTGVLAGTTAGRWRTTGSNGRWEEEKCSSYRPDLEQNTRVSAGKAWGQDTPPCKLGTVSSVGATG